MAQMVKRFIQVKGSGPFYMDEFCALTGMDIVAALRALNEAEKAGLLVYLDGIWLAYPRAEKARRQTWQDWSFTPQKVKRIYRLCYKERNFGELMKILGSSETLVRRYLVAMERAGILVSQRKGQHKYYSQGRWSQLESYQQEKKARCASLTGFDTSRVEVTGFDTSRVEN
ncbi:MAG: helix-turn-helix domain-containing protein [Candidatus Cloacimonetes bacterium]|nr:helix-turn-helix domain-containing protein [Candidatus Cloacimonadota bacterium]